MFLCHYDRLKGVFNYLNSNKSTKETDVVNMSEHDLPQGRTRLLFFVTPHRESYILRKKVRFEAFVEIVVQTRAIPSFEHQYINIET